MSVRKLKREREKRNWSLKFVSSNIGITKQSLHAIESGITDPSYKVLCRLEDLFKCSHRYLLAQVDEDTSSK